MPEPSPRYLRLMQWWWAYVVFGVLCLAFAVFAVVNRNPGWGLVAAGPALGGVSVISTGLMLRSHRPGSGS